jgi:ArsR family transcriptional regulator, arsenate/arsenite/antimonite-responsive transcriptional repressor / arsenate reductase (thioredoxin)
MSQISFNAQPPGLLRTLANEVRWNILLLLGHSDYCVQEIVRALDQPSNLVSYHLRKLHEQKLVTDRRSSADSRDIYYSLDFVALRTLYFAAADSLNPALNRSDTELQEAVSRLSGKPVRVLFLCTHNSARSQMAEGIMRYLSGGKVEALSAGSDPSALHPLAVQAMAKMGIDISQQRSKHMVEFAGQSFDYIVTVCDRVRESCPTWPDDPKRVHWSFLDPAAVEGSEQERSRAFEQVAFQLMTRLRYLLILIEREKGTTA